MKNISKAFTIEMTTEEVEALVGALEEITKIKGEAEKKAIVELDDKAYEDCANKYDQARSARNFFAGLIDRHYLGKDA